MIIDNSVNDHYIRSLNLGCFPKNVLEFQQSQDFFQQLVFVDYQLHVIIQLDFNGDELPEDTTKAQGKISTLLDYLHSISLNYQSPSYEESLYCSILNGHLLFLSERLDEMRSVLNKVTISNNLPDASIHQVEFVQYLTCRYFVLMGLTNYKFWLDYLVNFPESFIKSQVAAKHWLHILYFELGSTLSAKAPISFESLAQSSFFKNKISTIGFGSYLILHTKLVDSNFGSDFASFLSEEIERHLINSEHFPDASSSNSELDDYVNNLYESIEQFHHPIKPSKIKLVKGSTSKKFLVNCTSKTYQSKIVLTNLIYTLLNNNEYDEAYAAFNTLISYLDKDQENKGGYINDILSIINVYAACIAKFNPTNSEGIFKYTTRDTILTALGKYSERLIEYLNAFTEFGDLTYDENREEELSFLYKKFNPNIPFSDKSELIELISLAWYSLGYYYSYLSSDASSSYEALQSRINNCLKFYHNSLTVNATGNQLYLFTYALALANSEKLTPAIKLCKFILKRYPESFKTWNLLVLLLTAFEANNPKESRESEKFIIDALNIAGICISKNRKKLQTEVKHDILQLKLTQLAVLESIYGTSHILEYISEVFILYHELFEFDAGSAGKKVAEISKGIKDSKWSHRPSFIDGGSSRPAESYEPAPRKSLDEPGQPKASVLRRLSRVATNGGRSNHASGPETELARVKTSGTTKTSSAPAAASASTSVSSLTERKILQMLWLWTSRIYTKVGLLDEAEKCIVEAEGIYEANARTFTALGYLTSSSRKFLSLQEFERSLELLDNDSIGKYSKADYGQTLLGMCKLFIIDDSANASLFVSEKDKTAGMIRLKTMLEKCTTNWPYGYNNVEVWYFLTKIYEEIDDKTLLKNSLWRCVHLEDFRPVRSLSIIDSFRDL